MIEERKSMNMNTNIVQNVILENRGKLSVSGVNDVLSFDDQVVIVDTELGLLTVKGENIRINKLSLDTAEVIIEGEEEHTSIDLLAKKCYTKPLSLIRAKKLTRPTKIFPKGSEEYFFGRSGDYMAVRKDDIEDIYIIRGDIFEMTYEKDSLSK